jgi:hypothetical protein
LDSRKSGKTERLREKTLSFTFLFSNDFGKAKKERGMKEEGALSLAQIANLEGQKPKRARGPT